MSFDLSISVAGKVSYFEVNFSYVGLGNNVSLTYALQISAILPASFIFFIFYGYIIDGNGSFNLLFS